jgi:hypothetical protein
VLKRFRSGLFYPSEIINYRFEKKIITILYLLVLVILSALPSFIIMFGDDALSYADKKVIREAFRNEDVPYKIENYELIYTGNIGEDLFVLEFADDLNVIMTTESEIDLEISPFSVDTFIILTKDKVIYQRTLTNIELFSYSDYSTLQNLSFSGAVSDDYDFWSVVFPIINQQLERFSLFSGFVNVAVLFLVSLVSLVVLGLIITFFQKLFIPYLNFGSIFQLMIYALTPYVIGQLLASLFGFSLLSFVGILMTVIYASKLSRKLIQR